MPHLDIGSATLAIIFLLVGIGLQRFLASRNEKTLIKPMGEIAVIEKNLNFIIAALSTTLATIATYSMAYDEVQHIFDGSASTGDYVTAGQSLMIGLSVDIAAILAGSRIKAWLFRWRENKAEAKKDLPWFLMACFMFLLCLGSEGITSFYFSYRINPSAYPASYGLFMQQVHLDMATVRSAAPLVALFFFVAGILPSIVTLTDRKRYMQAETSKQALSIEMELINPDSRLSKDEKNTLYQAWETALSLLDFSSDATPETQAAHETLKQKIRESHGIVPESELKKLVTQAHLAQQNDAARLELESHLSDLEARLTSVHLDHIDDLEARVNSSLNNVVKNVLAEAQTLATGSQQAAAQMMAELEERTNTALVILKNEFLTALASNGDVMPANVAMSYDVVGTGAGANTVYMQPASITQAPPPVLKPLSQVEQPPEQEAGPAKPKRTRRPRGAAVTAGEDQQ